MGNTCLSGGMEQEARRITGFDESCVVLARFGRGVGRELTYIIRHERWTSARESRYRRSLVGNGVSRSPRLREEKIWSLFWRFGRNIGVELGRVSEVVAVWWYTHPFLRADSKLCSPGLMGVCYTRSEVSFSYSVYNQMDWLYSVQCS